MKKELLYEISTEDLWGVFQDMELSREESEKLLKNKQLLRHIEDIIAEQINFGEISVAMMNAVDEFRKS